MNHKHQKYLDKKSIHRQWRASKPHLQKKFDFIISIPCYDEYQYLFKTLESINRQDKVFLKNTLVSIVINNSSAETQKIINNNNRTFKKLLKTTYNYEILIVDAFSLNNSLNEKDAGVGMARKISVDMTLKWSHPNSIICFIDADTELSTDYLSKIQSSYMKHQWHAATVNFEHLRDESKTIDLIDNYEKFLKETSTNLKKSGSPYSYIPLGSTMLCTQSTYILAGGMNKRKAAEDFYFLQELQKFRNIFSITDVLIYPSSRSSDRCYLGTSTRMKKCLEGELHISDLHYSDESYQILRNWIDLALSSNQKNSVDILKKCKDIHSDLPGFLIEYNFSKAWDGILKSPSDIHFVKQFHRWFDAFKTFKLLKIFS